MDSTLIATARKTCALVVYQPYAANTTRLDTFTCLGSDPEDTVG